MAVPGEQESFKSQTFSSPKEQQERLVPLLLVNQEQQDLATEKRSSS